MVRNRLLNGQHSLERSWLSLLGTLKKNRLGRIKLKGGSEFMETKSRYEVIAELESKKRSLILERDSLDKRLKAHEKELKELKRDVEDKQEEIKDFKESMKDSKETTKELIRSVDDSLKRFEARAKK